MPQLPTGAGAFFVPPDGATGTADAYRTAQAATARAVFGRHPIRLRIRLLPSENTDLVSPNVGKSRNPDLTYLPVGALETTDNQVPAEVSAVAVELVSPSNPENDWIGKVRDYPLMGIPLYLLIDARLKTVTLFSRPDGTKYHRREDIEFGETLHIPEPFDFDLLTTGLLPY